MTQQTDRLNAALDGRYHIERELGVGGMATVYLADDLKHDRRVALKVLKPELAAVLGAERFVVEIKTTAALQHPHILPLFDSGTADSFLFYVMPFIEGETLRDKLNRETQLGVDEALRIAREVLDALQYAHEHGIVHRDVKPENILLHGGHAMVADFGIALAVSAAAGGRMTETGLSLGTPHYMSPEQATAEKEITARSDVYSLGSVLYEMLTGQPPHVGGSAQQIIMRIITDHARPVNEIRKSVPPNVSAAVAKSLEKLPADRFESAKAFADALASPTYTNAASAGTLAGGGAAGNSARLKRLLVGVSVLAVAFLVAAVWEWRAAHRDDDRITVRFPLSFPHGINVSSSSAPITISPDGRTVAFAGTAPGGIRQLYVRSLGDLQTRPLAGTEGAGEPFFSPDSRWLGFFSGGKLLKVPLDGGSVLPLTDLPPNSPYGASWSSSGVIVLSLGGSLYTVSATGGTLRPFKQADSAVAGHQPRWPVALPDGKSFLVTLNDSSASASARTIAVASLETGRSTVLDLAGTAPLGVVDGLLVYSNESGSLLAVPFDSRRARVTGAPAPVVTNVVVGGSSGMVAAGMSLTGSLVYLNGSSSSQVVLADAHGATKPLITDAKAYRYPRFSPDGKKIAITISSGSQAEVWVYDLAAHTNTKLTTDGRNGERPEWTPDGKKVLFQTRQAGKAALWWRPADLSGPAEPVFNGDTTQVLEGVFSPDGHVLVYKTSGQDIWLRRFDADTTPKAVAITKANETEPRVSPDGRWVAFASNESGAMQVFVQAFPLPGARTQLSTDGGTEPVWSRDGRQVYYRRADQFIAVTFATTPAFKVTSSSVMFEGSYVSGAAAHASYDISPDGKQFLLLKTAEEPLAMVVHDWRYELRAHMKQQAAGK